MDVTLTEMPPAGEPVLEQLMQLYAYDMGANIGEDGRFADGPTPPSTCWTESWRHAFLIRADGRIAGFTIIDERSRLTGDLAVADVAEFFVLRRYRRKRVGTTAATRAFSLYPRRWEVRQMASNTAAIAFWRRTISDYTGGAFSEVMLDDERWRGPVQSFDARPRPRSISARACGSRIDTRRVP